MNKNEKVKKTVFCISCGAEFDPALIRCPYCGTGYAPAEENEYMDRLEGIRTDLETHKEDADKRLKKGVGTTVLAVIVTVAVIISLLFAGMWFSGKSERNRAEQHKQDDSTGL